MTALPEIAVLADDVATLAEGRAELLKDDSGVYGVAFKGATYGVAPEIITRPDRLLSVAEHFIPILQAIPPANIFRHSVESAIADNLLTAMLARAGFSRHGSQRFAGGAWWSDTEEGRTANRKRYFGLKRKATNITNGLIREALDAGHPEALALARRFPPSLRYYAYLAMARSPRALQLGEVFPFLAYAIGSQFRRRADKADLARADEAMQMVHSGARLKIVANHMNVSMALRKVKPGAVGAAMRMLRLDNTRMIGNLDRLIHDFLPDGTAAQKRWLWAIYQASDIGGPYVDWVARNADQLGATIESTRAQVCDLSDWVRACYVRGVPPYVQQAITRDYCRPEQGERHVTRLFSPDMSLATVRALSGAWHENVALGSPQAARTLPPPWRDASQVGSLDVVPLTTAAAIAAEGRAMHHCAAAYIDKVANGECYLFSVRDGEKRIATIEVSRFGAGVSINQMRGPCNALLPKSLQSKLVRWVREKDKWSPPKVVDFAPAPLRLVGDDDPEIPF